MFNLIKRWAAFLARSAEPPQSRRASRRVRPWAELLEGRWCPAGTWVWNDTAAGLWSNPTGGAWLHNGAVAAAGQYPGMAGSFNDVVQFTNANTVDADLDVAIGVINTLVINNWNHELTLNNTLTVEGGAGTFFLGDNSTISIVNHVQGGTTSLFLWDLGGTGTNRWTNGTITGGANTQLYVFGTQLGILNGPVQLGTNMVIQKDANSGQLGGVTLINMTDELVLTGAGNYIDVANGGSLFLSQSIQAPAGTDSEGGITAGMGHTGQFAVQVENGGQVLRNGAAAPQGVVNAVQIQGAIYNLGGTVDVSDGNSVTITGVDRSGYSYWQQTSATALLEVDIGGNITAQGAYQIDAGTVKLTAPSGGSADELDGTGLVFGNANATKLTIVDSTPGTPGTVTIQGTVTLAQNTTTTLNFSGANNTADRLDVHNGVLTLNGTLNLQGDKKPTQALNFLDDSSLAPSIAGAFTSIMDNVGGTNDTGQVVQNNPQLDYYQVTIK